MISENTFNTTQTPLSAWLISQGFKILHINITVYPAIMSFEDSDALQKARRLWETGGAEGNCNIFFDNYSMLTKQVRPSWIWRNRKPTG